VFTALPEDVERFLTALVAFAEARDDVRAVALVGSRARGAARGADSDVDVLVGVGAEDHNVNAATSATGFPNRDGQLVRAHTVRHALDLGS
jgi:predicted nucleotidyltransferase